MKNTYKKQKGAGPVDALTSFFSGNKGNESGTEGKSEGFLENIGSKTQEFTDTTKETFGMKKSGQTDMGHLKEQISNLEQENVAFKKELEEKLRELQDKSSTTLENDKKKLSEDVEMKIKKNEEEIAEFKKKQSDLVEQSKKILAEATQAAPSTMAAATSGGGRRRRTRSRKVKKHKTRKSKKNNKKRKFRKTRKH